MYPFGKLMPLFPTHSSEDPDFHSPEGVGGDKKAVQRGVRKVHGKNPTIPKTSGNISISDIFDSEF